MKSKYILGLIFGLLNSFSAFGQNQAEIVGEDKFNVVIGVLAVIFVCIIIYMILIDRKITRLEKQNKQQ